MRHLLWLALAVACSKSSEAPPAPHHEDRHEATVAPARLDLAVTIDGSAATWSHDVFDGVPKMAGTASDGEARDTWSLRELVHHTVGPNARVVAVVGDVTKAIDRGAWDDPSRTPILHTTKRGALKFRWADPSGKWGDTEVKNVTRLEIVR
jgi:hypothetical protein